MPIDESGMLSMSQQVVSPFGQHWPFGCEVLVSFREPVGHRVALAIVVQHDDVHVV